MSRTVVRAAFGLAVSASVLLVGCASDESDQSAPTTSPPLPADLREPVELSADLHGFSATLQQYREDEVSNEIAVKITSAAEQPIVVDTLRLEWPGMVTSEPNPIGYKVFPRTRVDLRVPATEPVCSNPPQLDETTPDVPIAAVAETDVGTIVFPVTDPEGVLARIYPRECRRQSIEHSATFTLGEWEDVSADPPTVNGVLTIARNGTSDPIVVDAVHGGVLINFAAEGLPAPLESGDGELRISVVATNNRCDSHALGESKKPYLFQVDLTIGDESVTYVVPPQDSTKTALSDWIIHRCPAESA